MHHSVTFYKIKQTTHNQNICLFIHVIFIVITDPEKNIFTGRKMPRVARK